MRDTNGRRATPITFLGRLARDTRGNTLALAAAAMFPLLGMIGSGLDMGRIYLVKARLQQACDAGVLAARKSMTGTALDTTARNQATSFFNINLRAGPYPNNPDGTPGTGPHGANVSPLVVSDVIARNPATGTDIPTGTVHGVANATVPMTIMQLFGTNQVDLQVTCDAELNVSNQDILFVLDTTGSMACLPSDAANTCDNYVPGATQQVGGVWTTVEKTDSRIDALRSAVKRFYTAVNTAKAPGSRLRIGFLPYSSGVNVGRILPTGTLNATNLVYATRTANFNSVRHTPDTVYSGWTEQTYGTQLNGPNCTKYSNNQAFTGYTPTAATATPTAVITTGSATPAPVNSTEFRYKSGKTGTDTSTGTCKRETRTGRTTYTTRWRFTNWTYESDTTNTIPVADYIAGNEQIAIASATSETTTQGDYNPIQLATMQAAGTAFDVTVVNSAWDGCIEERLSGNADINGAAGSEETRWRPAWRDITYGRSGPAAQTTTASESGVYYRADQSGNGYGRTPYSCPKAAALPAELSAAQVAAYVDAADFVAHGRTYHDIGMIWGARIMSTTSVFSGLHGPAPNTKPISRNIIFMTDGEIKPTIGAYSPYGIEKIDRRVGNGTTVYTDSTLPAEHTRRFLAACQAAQDNGVNVWVVSFGRTLSNDLTTCASSDSQAYEALNADSLNSALAQIAQRIADLRLTS